MLTRDAIRKMARYSYNRGMDLYTRKKVLTYEEEENGDKTEIEASVRGSTGKLYDVRLEVDTGKDAVKSSYCDCPAFYSYSDLCKHCVAVLLEYADRHSAKHRPSLSDYLESGQVQMGRSLQPGMKAVQQRRPQTTARMKELLQKQTIRQTLPILQSETCGKVRIEPILTCQNNECSVEFRIGVNKMYVLKDIFQFAQSMRDRENFSYGKNLQFIHAPESFAEASRPLAEFIGNWVEKNRKNYVQSSFYYSYYRPAMPKLRHLPLDGWDLEAFLDAVGTEAFLANVNGEGEKQWRLTDEDLRRKVTIAGKPDGMEVRLDYVFGYECSSNFIYFADQKIYRIPKSRMEDVQEFLDCMRELPGKKAFVEKEDMPAFFRQLLPALKGQFECEISDIREEDLGIVPVSFQFYLDLPQEDFVTCEVKAVYGGREYSVYDRAKDVEKRDLWKEAEIGKIAAAFCNAYEEEQHRMVISQDQELMYKLLTEGIPRLQELGEVYVSEALRRVRVVASPKVSVGISLSGDLLNLQITSEDMSKEQLIEILSRYDRKRKFFRLKDGSFIQMEEEGIANLQSVCQTLGLTDRKLVQDTIKIPEYRALFLDGELQSGYNISVRKDKNFRSLIRSMKTVEENDFEVPPHLQDVLREYQKYGFYWIETLYHNGFGGILADDMGLGKTLQVICFLTAEMGAAGSGQPNGTVYEAPGKAQQEAAAGAAFLKEQHGAAAGAADADGKTSAPRRCLIVCPASLVYNWKRELEKFSPQLPARIVAGTAAEREAILQSAALTEILITSYDLLRRDLEQYEKLDFFCQVIDEAQYIKNHGTQAAKAVKAVNAGFKLALTGTPVENRLSELWSIFDYLMPGYLYTYQRFREELEQPVVQKDDEDAALRLQKMIRPFVLRRLKQEVLRDLPDKLEENIYACMEGEQQELYDAHVKRIRIMLDEKSEEEFKSSKIQILAELTKLRQLCCDPALLYENYEGGSAKKEMVVNLIQNAVENGHKVLLFSQFTSMLERLAAALREENIPYHMLTGATPKEKRAEMVEAFAHDEIPVFCISLKAGGTGLNLTAADVVIHFDPWWNVAVQNQATDRAHRIGQKNAVNVYRLIAKGTIEEKIIDLQERKLELADRILGGEAFGSGSLSKEELMELLR